MVDYTKRNVKDQYASIDEFLTAWKEADRKQAIVDELEKRGVFFDDLSDEIGKDLDPFDMILHIVAYACNKHIKSAHAGMTV